MDYILLTNNPRLKDEAGAKMIQGSFRDVLLAARDHVYLGHELITHPLFASAGMMYSPYRSILLSTKKEHNSQHAELIANSILDYDKLMQRRKPDENNQEDYARIDQELYLSALDEHKRLQRR